MYKHAYERADTNRKASTKEEYIKVETIQPESGMQVSYPG